MSADETSNTKDNERDEIVSGRHRAIEQDPHVEELSTTTPQEPRVYTPRHALIVDRDDKSRTLVMIVTDGEVSK